MSINIEKGLAELAPWGVGIEWDPQNTKGSRTDNQNTLFDKQRWRLHYYNALSNIVWSMFEWKNLPETINPYYLEKMLHTFGYMAFYDDPVMGKMIVHGAHKELNPYQEPLTYQAAMVNYHASFPLRTFLTPDDEAIRLNMGVLLPNMQGATLGQNVFASSQNALDLFSHMLAENKITQLVAQNHLKVPYIVETDQDNQLSARNFINEIQQNKAAIFVNRNMNGTFDNFRVHDLGVSGAIEAVDKLNIARVEIVNEFLTFFGINNFATQKKERVITNEVSSNNEMVGHALNKFLFPRQKSAEIVNRLWGTDIQVGLRENIQTIIEAELGLTPEETGEMSKSESQ